MGRRRCRPRTCAPRSWRPCRAGSGRRRAAPARASSCRCARCSTGSPPGSGCSRPRSLPRRAWPGPRCSRCWGAPSSLTVRRPWGPGSALLWRPVRSRPSPCPGLRRHQRRGDLVGCEHVLVRARPVGQQRARDGLRLRVPQQRVHL